ncbi:MAG: hypothetical protein AAF488_00875 [Planctomycetota bacterium]
MTRFDDSLSPEALELYLAVRPQYGCAEPAASLYQDLLRKQVLRAAESRESGGELLRRAALAHLEHENVEQVEHALSVLFVLGRPEDLDRIAPHTNHPTAAVAKAARTCHFEIRHRA